MSIKKRRTLGKLIAVYNRPPMNWAGFFMLSSLGIAIVFIPLWYGNNNYAYAYTSHGPVAAIYKSRTWYLITIFNLLIYCIIIAIYRANKRHKIQLHQHGLLINHGSTRKIFWDEIFGIAHGIMQSSFLTFKLPESYLTTIYLLDGTRIKLDPQIKDLAILASQIQSQILPIIAPIIEKEFDEGNWLQFGIIQLNKHAIRILGQDISWANIISMAVQSGLLVFVLANQQNLSVRVNKIPNLELVLRIAKAGVKI